MSNSVTHISKETTWVNKNEIRRRNKFQAFRDRNKCGNNVWKRVDVHTQILQCKQTGERCSITNCPCFSKQS